MVLGVPGDVGLGDKTAKIACRARITRCACRWQESFRRDRAVCRLDALCDELGDRVTVVALFNTDRNVAPCAAASMMHLSVRGVMAQSTAAPR